jgi:SAM-dependent methyltransferase
MNMMTVNPTKTIPPIKFGGNTSLALTPEEVQEFGRKIDAIRTETMAKIGKEDSDYIYKVRNFVRYTEIASRGMLMFGGWIPPVWLLGEAPLAVGRLHAQQDNVQNIEYRQIPVEQLAQEQAGQYDVVTCMEMMEHVPDPASIVKACQSLVKPGGHVFFSTINRNPKSYLFAIIGAEYVLRLLPKGTHDYHKFIRPSEMAHDIRNAGLTLKEMTGLHYNPITKHYWLAPNVDVNYMVHTMNTGA